MRDMLYKYEYYIRNTVQSPIGFERRKASSSHCQFDSEYRESD